MMNHVKFLLCIKLKGCFFKNKFQISIKAGVKKKKKLNLKKELKISTVKD